MKKVPDPNKVKEYHNLFLKNIDKKIYKLLKTIVKPNIFDIKQLLLNNQKLLLNHQSMQKKVKSITQQPDFIEKSSTVDIKSITIEHPKTATKLSKPIMQPKIITQQQKICKKIQHERLQRVKSNCLQAKTLKLLEYIRILRKNFHRFIKLKF